MAAHTFGRMFRASPCVVAYGGITIGQFDHRSTTHTTLQANPWWQVDLGLSVPIESVQIWNRTDCCSERLNNYWVFASEKPFETEQSLERLKLRPDVAKSFQVATPCPSTTVRLPQAHGRYVRVQLQGTGYLSLAEVKVFSSSKRAD